MPEEILGEALGVAADVAGSAAEAVEVSERRTGSGCGCFLLLAALVLGGFSVYFTFCAL